MSVSRAGSPRFKDRTNQSAPVDAFEINTTEDETTSASLNIVAYPQPTLTTVVFLGTSSSSSNRSVLGQRSGVLTVECRPTLELYVFSCVLTAVRPASSDQGFYSITLDNPFGEITHIVKLTVMPKEGNDNNEDTATSQFPLGAVAGGAGGAVVLLVIFAVIVVIVVKRRKAAKAVSKEIERKHISANSDDDFEEHINIVYESSDDVVLTTQPQTGASKPPTTSLRVSPFTKPTDKDEQETSFGYVTLNGEKPTENGSAPVNRRVLISQYTDVADAYSTVDDDGLTFFAASSGWKFIPQSTAGLSSDYADVDAYSSVDDGREDFLAGQARCQTDMASDYADADGYSSVKESGPRMETPPQKASGTQDDYAVVNNAGKAAKGSAQPDDYAQVNKTSKPGNPSTAPESEKYAKPKPDVYARVQKSKPRHETDVSLLFSSDSWVVVRPVTFQEP
ncbi:hypothetical protein BaRGS_00036273 [Batillaria attramentaria]|uniref:Uncharacterized protein n=1 Tax=Batillaria attramentaria TaxID=370345 RepID=A0ABD0JCC2_9CAEN